MQLSVGKPGENCSHKWQCGPCTVGLEGKLARPPLLGHIDIDAGGLCTIWAWVGQKGICTDNVSLTKIILGFNITLRNEHLKSTERSKPMSLERKIVYFFMCLSNTIALCL